jgi:hypothetical protein
MSTQPPSSSAPSDQQDQAGASSSSSSAPETYRPDQKLNTKSDSHGNARAGVHVDAAISPTDNKADNPAETQTPGPAGKGMPARNQVDQPDLTGRQITQSDAATETHLELPSDRDQAADMTSNVPDPAVQQAARDVQQGLKDTSKASETDSTYSKLRNSDDKRS